MEAEADVTIYNVLYFHVRLPNSGVPLQKCILKAYGVKRRKYLVYKILREHVIPFALLSQEEAQMVLSMKNWFLSKNLGVKTLQNP